MGFLRNALMGNLRIIVVEFNEEGGTVNLVNPENFSGNLPGSIDSTRDCKL